MTQFSSLATPKHRVALFIDGENLSSAHADRVLSLAGSHGDPVLRRVYGNVPLLNGWASTPGLRMVHSGTGKNSTDMLICIEAMHVALTNQADIIVIAASDRDYAHLATYLREAGFPVFGVGEEKAAQGLRQSYSGFHPLQSPVLAPQKPPAAPAPQAVDKLMAAVRKALSDPRGMPIQQLGVVMHRQGFRISDQPERTWRNWLGARGSIFICDPRGPEACVRLRQPG